MRPKQQRFLSNTSYWCIHYRDLYCWHRCSSLLMCFLLYILPPSRASKDKDVGWGEGGHRVWLSSFVMCHHKLSSPNKVGDSSMHWWSSVYWTCNPVLIITRMQGMCVIVHLTYWTWQKLLRVLRRDGVRSRREGVYLLWLAKCLAFTSIH